MSMTEDPLQICNNGKKFNMDFKQKKIFNRKDQINGYIEGTYEAQAKNRMKGD